MQDDEAIGLRLGEELRSRERLAAVRLDADCELARPRRKLAHAALIVRYLGAGDELAHIMERPAVVRGLAPVRERGLGNRGQSPISSLRRRRTEIGL